jgi:hypothetical protein
MSRIYFPIIFSILIAVSPNQIIMMKKNVPDVTRTPAEWIISDLIKSNVKGVTIVGKPAVSKCKYGDAVVFNGEADAILMDNMPLSGLDQFTVEVIFQPSGDGNFEQRFLHLGEVQGDRVLLELRSTEAGWYFDGFIKTGDQDCTLIDPALLHPSDQWYHVAYVVDHGDLSTWVNGKKELEGRIVMKPVSGNTTSIGARQNKVSWYKGLIYKIRITNIALTPGNFMTY